MNRRPIYHFLTLNFLHNPPLKLSEKMQTNSKRNHRKNENTLRVAMPLQVIMKNLNYFEMLSMKIVLKKMARELKALAIFFI